MTILITTRMIAFLGVKIAFTAVLSATLWMTALSGMMSTSDMRTPSSPDPEPMMKVKAMEPWEMFP